MQSSTYASDVSAPLLSYETPELFSLVSTIGETQGGTVHVLNGTGLGLEYAGSYVELSFGAAGSEAVIPLDGADLLKWLVQWGMRF